jgi:hypothetical protein
MYSMIALWSGIKTLPVRYVRGLSLLLFIQRKRKTSMTASTGITSTRLFSVVC